MRSHVAFPFVAFSLAVSFAAACSVFYVAGCSSKKDTFADDGDGDTNGGITEAGTFAEGGFGQSDGTADDSECNASTKSVYVISQDNLLYSFTPETLAFKPIGSLACGSGGATPTSMAVDRTGIAWVLLSDGTVSRVSVKDGSCTPTQYMPGQMGFTKFGMAFSTDTANGSSESLYLSDHFGKGLAKLDTTTLAVTQLGEYSDALSGLTAELTGTGDGRLFGFFTTSPAIIAEVNKSTGSILSQQSIANTYAGTAWAFSFYGGDFYVYTADNSGGGLPEDGTGSDVTRYRPSDGSVQVLKSKIGFTIVGAGVSTCAPTTLVK